MHLIMITLVLLLSVIWRWPALEARSPWSERYSQALNRFLFPPLLLFTTALAVVCMGPQGQMAGLWVGGVSYVISLGFLLGAGGLLLWQYLRSLHSLHRLHHLPLQEIDHHPLHVLEAPTLLAAQIGLWHPRLVISQGVLDRLGPDHLQAVLTHEQAHHHFRDTFTFFWLGWLRRLTCWLPHTHTLWQELLLLREIRADQWAAQQVDPLLLAEALWMFAADPVSESWSDHCVGLNESGPASRLEQRIDHLLDPSITPAFALSWNWIALSSSLLPILVIPLHS
ncbi:MAG: M56 family peptidase [Synechococcaceae cyanobacterium SM2_3_1]|nr:M56 family peptidase [Synechococcaceae cyanobacterium SM2_3_1]